MATREENIQKSNAELEIMSDDELDVVVGGTVTEMVDDSKFLDSILSETTKYHNCGQYSRSQLKNSIAARENIVASWHSLGIDYSWNAKCNNKYFFDGEEISRGTAYKLACLRVRKSFSYIPESIS